MVETVATREVNVDGDMNQCFRNKEEECIKIILGG